MIEVEETNEEVEGMNGPNKILQIKYLAELGVGWKSDPSDR
jgi:hypothetical protein